jgi:hypothetical protein
MWKNTKEEYLYYKSRNGKIWKVPTYGKIFYIIDFGRASIIDSGSPDIYFSREEKAAMLEIVARMDTDFNKKVQNDKDKIIFMRHVIDYITYQEKGVYEKLFPGYQGQLKWIEKYIDDEIMLSAFNKLLSMMLVNIDRGIGISYSTINRNHPHRLDFPHEPEPVVKRANTELEPEPEAERGPVTKRKRGGKSKKSKTR